MSLDVYLTLPDPQANPAGSGIFVRESGETREISREEWDEKFPGREPVTFRGDEEDDREIVFSANITHNLNGMADEAGIYKHLWRPDEIGVKTAGELIGPLEVGLALLRSDPARFEALNPPNGWGSYAGFVPWVERYLEACRRWPMAEVRVSR